MDVMTPAQIQQLLRDLAGPSTTPGTLLQSETPFQVQDNDQILTSLEDLYGQQALSNTAMHLTRIENLPLEQLSCDPEIIVSQTDRMQRERDAAIQERDFKNTQLVEATAGRDRAERRCHELYTVLQAVGQERKVLQSKYNWLYSQLREKGLEAKRLLQQQWDDIRRYKSQCEELAQERDRLKNEAEEASVRLRNTESQLRTVVEERDNLQKAVVEATVRLTNTALERDQFAAEAKWRLSRCLKERNDALQQRDEAQAALADLRRRFDSERAESAATLGLSPGALDDLIVTRPDDTAATLQAPPNASTNVDEPALPEPDMDVKLEEEESEEPMMMGVTETTPQYSPATQSPAAPTLKRKRCVMDCVLLPPPRYHRQRHIRRRKMRIESATPE